jgi:Phosphatase-1 catalytic subunit binding region
MQRMLPIRRRLFQSTTKHVTFSDVSTVRYQSQWSESDYRSARRGPWMFYAVERMRFERRIKQFEINCGYILAAKHRELIRSRIEYFMTQCNVFANRIMEFERNYAYIFNSVHRRLMKYVVEYFMQ